MRFLIGGDCQHRRGSALGVISFSYRILLLLMMFLGGISSPLHQKKQGQCSIFPQPIAISYFRLFIAVKPRKCSTSVALWTRLWRDWVVFSFCLDRGHPYIPNNQFCRCKSMYISGFEYRSQDLLSVSSLVNLQDLLIFTIMVLLIPFSQTFFLFIFLYQTIISACWSISVVLFIFLLGLFLVRLDPLPGYRLFLQCIG